MADTSRCDIQFTEPTRRFTVETKKFERQYNQLYLSRLHIMRKAVKLQAENRWGTDLPLFDKIIESENHEDDRDCILVGTLYKELSLRGSVLEEFKNNNGMSGAVESTSNIASDSDSLVLEDESGRVSLGGKIMQHIGELVTGIVFAVRGIVNESGVFHANDWTFYFDRVEKAAEVPVPPVATESETQKYVMILSGLSVGNETQRSVEHGLAIQLLSDFVSGRSALSGCLTGTSSIVDIGKLPGLIGRIIIAGDSIASPGSAVATRDRQSTAKSQVQQSETSRELDVILSQFLTSCPVDILPGASDPSSLLLPQQPLHRCILPMAARFSTLTRVTNPFEGAYDGVTFLGHSGQPVSDIARQTHHIPAAGDGVFGEDRLNILCNTLQWGHIAPTCPGKL